MKLTSLLVLKPTFLVLDFANYLYRTCRAFDDMPKMYVARFETCDALNKDMVSIHQYLTYANTQK